MAKAIRITHTITVVNEVPFDDDHYSGQNFSTVEDAIEFEKNIGNTVRWERFAYALEDGDKVTKDEVVVEAIDVPDKDTTQEDWELESDADHDYPLGANDPELQ